MTANTASAERIPCRLDPITIEEQTEGFYAVLAGSAGRVLITNELGRRIISEANGELTEAEIIAAITDDYPDVGAEQILADTQRFLSEAIERGVLTWK